MLRIPHPAALTGLFVGLRGAPPKSGAARRGPELAQLTTPVRVTATRAPSRRMVRELSNTLMAAPIVFGLALPIAAPWPTHRAAPASHETSRAPDRLRKLTHDEISVALLKAAHDAKIVKRAAPKIIRPVYTAASTIIPFAGVGVRPPGPRLASVREDVHLASGTKVAADGSLIVRGEKIALDGVELPKPGDVCHRLDGADVPCIERVVARLTIITQMRTVECRTRLGSSGERLGDCRAGKIDLARDLVAAKLARRITVASVGNSGV